MIISIILSVFLALFIRLSLNQKADIERLQKFNDKLLQDAGLKQLRRKVDELFYKTARDFSIAVDKAIIEKIRSKLVKLAILKQAYIKGTTSHRRIENSIKMQKEEFLILWPEYYDAIFADIDTKQKDKFNPHNEKFQKLVEDFTKEAEKLGMVPMTEYRSEAFVLDKEKCEQVKEAFDEYDKFLK